MSKFPHSFGVFCVHFDGIPFCCLKQFDFFFFRSFMMNDEQLMFKLWSYPHPPHLLFVSMPIIILLLKIFILLFFVRICQFLNRRNGFLSYIKQSEMERERERKTNTEEKDNTFRHSTSIVCSLYVVLFRKNLGVFFPLLLLLIFFTFF